MADSVLMPKLGFDMAEGTLVRWVIGEGETVKKGDILAEIETDKATVEVESSFSGIVGRQLVSQGSSIPVGDPIAIITAPGEDFQSITPAKSKPTSILSHVELKEEISHKKEDLQVALLPTNLYPSASPLAKKMARENAIDLRAIKGSGPGKRVVRKDIETYLASKTSVPSDDKEGPPSPATPSAPRLPFVSNPGAKLPDITLTIDRLRGAIGRRMVQSKQLVPHFYITHEFDVETLLILRQEINKQVPEEQKFSFNDFIIKATAMALRQFPNLNAKIEGTQLVLRGQINIGVAVAVEGGLLTIVCHDSDQKPLRQISAEVKEKAERARQGKVRPDDVEDSTFSISNLGMFDVENFFAIINPPEAAILAVSSARQVPVVANGELRIGTHMKATLSADHRLTDGAEAAQFLQELARYLEQPLKILI